MRVADAQVVGENSNDGEKITAKGKEVINAVVNPKSINAAEKSVKNALSHIKNSITEKGKEKGKEMLTTANENLVKKQLSGTITENLTNSQIINKNAEKVKDKAKENKVWGFW